MVEQQADVVPGVFTHVPMDTYHGWQAASNSRLTHLMRSPAHLKAYMDAEHRDTPALAFGRAAHAAILEPDTFKERFVTATQCVGVTKDKKRCSRDGVFHVRGGGGMVCTQHAATGPDVDDAPSVEVLSTDDHRKCLAMRDAVHAQKRASGMLTGPGEVEMSVVWTDPESGVLCKSRWDRHSPELSGGTVVDLKTTRDAGPLTFERSIFSFGYHRQAALYLMGAKVRKLPARHYSIIAVEKEPPYGVAIYRMTEGAIQAGEDQIRPLLRRYAECVRTDTWPGYPDEVRDISLPRYAWDQINEQVEDVA